MNTSAGLGERLRAGETVVGVMVSAIRNPEIAPILSAAGYDFMVVDMEHSVITAESVGAILLAAGSASIAAFVRPPSKGSDEIPRMVDAGAVGLLVPHVECADDARSLVRRIKYSPMGERGVAMTRAHSRFRKPVDARAYAERANRDTILAVQVESILALERIRETVSVEGVDIAFMGPADLAQSLGLLGETAHPRVWDAFDRVVHACKGAGKVAGTMVHDAAGAQQAIRRGAKFVIYSNDISLLVSGGRSALEQLRRLT